MSDHDQVLIGPFCYSINKMHIPADDDVQPQATVNYLEQNIMLHNKLAASGQLPGVWHEVLHILLANAGIMEHPEQVITILANGIVSALFDNPWLAGIERKAETSDPLTLLAD